VAFVSESRDLRYTFARLSKGGQLLPGWYKEWYPDAQGNYTYDSLRATPYGDSTLGQAYDFDGFIPDPRGANGFYTKQIPTAWGYKPAIRRSGHGFAPYAEARFNLDEDMFFYVKYAQGWKMPSLFESTLGNSTSAPVADLKPEKNRSWDIGFSLLKQDLWRDGDRLAFKVAWFKNDIDNAITRRFDSSNWAFYVDNVDNYTVSGYELQSGYDAGIAYLDLSASYYQRAHLRCGHRQAPARRPVCEVEQAGHHAGLRGRRLRHLVRQRAEPAEVLDPQHAGLPPVRQAAGYRHPPHLQQRPHPRTGQALEHHRLDRPAEHLPADRDL
jgi:hypothetical protein